MFLKWLVLFVSAYTIRGLTASTEDNCPAASTTQCQSRLDKVLMLEKYLKINEERSVQLDKYFDDFKKQIKTLNAESNTLLKNVFETVLLSYNTVDDEEVRRNQIKLEAEVRNLREEMQKMRQMMPETSTQPTAPEVEPETDKPVTPPEVIQEKPQGCGESAKLPKDCLEVLKLGNDTSGAYCIRPKTTPFMVFCDMESRDGGWTVIQNRFDGSQNFSLGWKEYRQGFGDVLGEFWLGLDRIYELTGIEDNELLVKLVARNRTEAYAFFTGFNIGNETEEYKLKFLDDYEGTAGNSLAWHKEQKFSTVDHAEESVRDCVTKSEGGWWFRPPPPACMQSNLNGRYYADGVSPGGTTGVNWFQFSTDDYSLVASRMMVRRQTVFFSR